eukprot:5135791-Prymnesium_polylepis.2
MRLTAGRRWKVEGWRPCRELQDAEAHADHIVRCANGLTSRAKIPLFIEFVPEYTAYGRTEHSERCSPRRRQAVAIVLLTVLTPWRAGSCPRRPFALGAVAPLLRSPAAAPL